jgi:crotonobetainyl-CoA:carnitine CoA-transferase CaiB-like acyl-CoA transferase
MLPLDGVRVLSFNHFLMGPLGIQMLGDLGADVIAIEPIEGAWQRHWSGADRTVDGQSLLFLCANRNKRNLALNLKAPEGRAIVHKLVATADIVAENYRPGVMDKLGIGYEALKAIKPDIIYAAASGYGADGPYRDRPGQDLLIQALSGFATITGKAGTGKPGGGARAAGVSAIDHHGAALFAVGILGALARKLRTGEGGRVDVDLLSAALDLQTESVVCYFNGPPPPSTQPPEHIAGWHYPAPYGIYATRDGELAISFARFDLLAEILDAPALTQFDDKNAYERRAEIAPIVAAATARRTTAELVAALTAKQIWHAPVNDYAAVAADPQVRHNRSLTTVEGATGAPITLVSNPLRYDGAAPPVRLAPQKLGAQTAEILGEIGYDADQVRALERDGVVTTAKG